MRGCQKKVIFLKNTGSNIFDEAYFVVSKLGEKAKDTEENMIIEANRIIEANGDFDTFDSDFKIGKLKLLLIFAAGAILGSALTALISYL